MEMGNWQEKSDLEMDLDQTRKEKAERQCLIIYNNICTAGQTSGIVEGTIKIRSLIFKEGIILKAKQLLWFLITLYTWVVIGLAWEEWTGNGPAAIFITLF